MATCAKQTAACITSNSCRPQKHYRSCQPRMKTRKTNPFPQRAYHPSRDQTTKPVPGGTGLSFRERGCNLKKLTINHVKGFLQPLVTFCIRCHSGEWVTASTQRSRDDLHELGVRGFQMTSLSLSFSQSITRLFKIFARFFCRRCSS